MVDGFRPRARPQLSRFSCIYVSGADYSKKIKKLSVDDCFIKTIEID